MNSRRFMAPMVMVEGRARQYGHARRRAAVHRCGAPTFKSRDELPGTLARPAGIWIFPPVYLLEFPAAASKTPAHSGVNTLAALWRREEAVEFGGTPDE